MKSILTFLFAVCATLSVCAKDMKTVVVTTSPQMHCDNCEKRIKGNMRFERGVKRVETNIPKQTVTIEYDADKTTVDELLKGFKKFGYEASVVNPDAKTQADRK